MFELSDASRWMESLRVPAITMSGNGGGEFIATWRPSGRRLAWFTGGRDSALERLALGHIPLFARGITTQPPTWGAGWTPRAELTRNGSPVAFVWQSDDGSIFLPFDPDEAVLALQTEAYVSAGKLATSTTTRALARKAYYRARPLLPRSAQLAMRRAYSRLQGRQRFPAWPIETALHDLADCLLLLASEAAGEPIPALASWPRPFRWALVLTHDVETAVGYARIRAICDHEAALGYRSSWNLVPRRDYEVLDEDVRELRQLGWEVGVHGLHHDGRDLESERMLSARRPQMRKWAERWEAAGFRSPATQRDWSLMPSLGFDYDSSYPDTDPFEPQGGGCCSWLPFFNGDLVELPITLAQDHTLFVILRETDATLWIDKAEFLRQRGGMALIDTHPDYVMDEPAASAYAEFLKRFADDNSAWRALPAEVASWWRRRAATSLERRDGRWELVGPASGDAAIVFPSSQSP
jgi:hypothetical protein